MKIGSIDVKISIIAVAVFVLFTLLLLFTYFLTGERFLLIWGIPSLVLLLIIPSALNYMSQKEYAELEPVYRQQAKNIRIRMINESMVGQIVRLEGVVERVYFQFLNRPQYLVADRTGEISVKMFTSPQEKVNKGDVVEVLGMVIKRYIATGEAVVNCVSIKKIDKKIEAKKKE
ncbi:MAG: hypothetical protein A4E35_00720 [Methanoregula sp. PtaU1.Bin051]|nr:MAG: hypothetical protein A4E35_00720 [Methanoregula sp. PtaU1.Bin051]